MVSYFMRRRGGPLVLSSLSDEDFSAISASSRSRIEAGGMLSEMEMHEAVVAITHEARLSLLRWIQDKRYIPRLVLSAAVFIILYLFFSVVIRDPLPIVDEVVFSFIGSALLWIALARYDERSSLMRGKMASLELAIEHSEVMVSPFIAEAEGYYEALYAFSPLELAEMIADDDLPVFSWPDDGLASGFTAAFLIHLKKADSGIGKTIQRIDSEKNRDVLVRFLVHQVTMGALDLPDLAFFRALTGKRI